VLKTRYCRPVPRSEPPSRQQPEAVEESARRSGRPGAAGVRPLPVLVLLLGTCASAGFLIYSLIRAARG
jgi:hypothetical protein